MINWERVLLTAAVGLALFIGALIAYGWRHKQPAPLPPIHALVQAPIVVPVPKRTAVAVRRPVYHKVLPGGRIDGSIDCKYVRSLTNNYEDVKTYGPTYAGLSEAKVRQLKVCFP